MRKIYTCERWPFLRLGAIQFQDGKYTTEDTDEQHVIENSEAYGVQVRLESESEVEVEVVSSSSPEPKEEPASRKAPSRSAAGGARQGQTGTGHLHPKGE